MCPTTPPETRPFFLSPWGAPGGSACLFPFILTLAVLEKSSYLWTWGKTWDQAGGAEANTGEAHAPPRPPASPGEDLRVLYKVLYKPSV